MCVCFVFVCVCVLDYLHLSEGCKLHCCVAVLTMFFAATSINLPLSLSISISAALSVSVSLSLHLAVRLSRRPFSYWLSYILSILYCSENNHLGSYLEETRSCACPTSTRPARVSSPARWARAPAVHPAPTRTARAAPPATRATC